MRVQGTVRLKELGSQVQKVCGIAQFLSWLSAGCALIFISEDEDCVKTWNNDLRLSLHDKKTLLSHAWLSANHISAANFLLKSKYPNQNGLQDTSYLRDKLIWQSSVKNFVQIVNIDGCHWVCVSNRFAWEENTLQVYDSLMTATSDKTTEQLCTILKCSNASFKVQVMNVQLQQSSDSCGLFAVAMAFDLCDGKDPCYTSYKESLMRGHLAKCFQENQVTRFPCHRERRSFQRKIVHEKEVLVYCTCRYADSISQFGDMAQCESCSEWYHEICDKIPRRVLKENDEHYICQKCSVVP